QKVDILAPESFQIYVEEIKNSCQGSDGYIKLFILGPDDSETFNFSWSNGQHYNNIPWGDIMTLDHLSNGRYCVTVTSNSTSCTLEDCYELGDGGSSTITLYSQLVMPCKNQYNGKIILNPVGGNTPYTYNWNPPVYPEFAQEGNYCVTVTDICGITATGCYTLEAMDVFLTYSNECLNEGIAQVDISGGNPPFDIKWYRIGPTPIGSGPSINHLNDGYYRVIVKDNNNCSIYKNFTLNYEYKNFLVDKKNNSNCIGNEESCDGFIKIGTKGNKMYTYSWSGPNGFSSTTKDIGNLCTGVYNLTVTESNGCTELINVNICCCYAEGSEYSECDGTGLQLNVTKSVVSPKTNMSTDGSITINVSGGLGQYYYKWTGPDGFTSTEKDLMSIKKGNYCVTVTDGCHAKNECIELRSCEEKNIQITGMVTNNCDGFTEGKIEITINNGEEPYTYKWSNGFTVKNPLMLTAGTYCITVTDNNKCTATNCFTVNSYPPEYTDNVQRCERTLHCNGKSKIIQYNYIIEDLVCNTLYYRCELSPQIFSYDLGWKDIWLQNCTLFLLCQDDYLYTFPGQLVEGPFIYFDQDCDNYYRCYQYACSIIIQGEEYLFVNDLFPYTCAFLSVIPDESCPPEQCLASLYCNGWNDLIWSGCIDDDICNGLPLKKPWPTDFIKKLDSLIFTRFDKLSKPEELLNIGLDDIASKIPNRISENKKSLKFNNINNNRISIMPNPFDNLITINFNNIKLIEGKILISNIYGQEIYQATHINSSNNYEIRLDNIISGVYICRIFDGNNCVLSNKLIKN
ncbi:MAG: T9SS type A sorting domain-containing protein, partial [Saprospiraceae bacterium]